MALGHKNKIALGAFLTLDVVFLGLIIGILNTRHPTFALLSPAGPIAQSQKHLLLLEASIMLFVVFCVVTAAYIVAIKYKASNQNSNFEPETKNNNTLQLVWWAIPTVVVLIIAAITWKWTPKLDPYQQISNGKDPLIIQVVSLNWKWLFIYPNQGVASVNLVAFPQNTPVEFRLTSDAPMNSFWIPQLGGQMYSMAGMSTKLHLLANKVGDYQGSSAEINGKGFADMRFNAKALTQAEFDQWVQTAKSSNANLSLEEYNNLAKDSTNNPVTVYANVETNLYNEIINKYMAPTSPMH